MSGKSSIIIDNIPGGWGIRGFTSSIRQDLIDCGATWNDTAVRWEIKGTKLPECVKKAIGSLSSLDTVKKPATPENVPQQAASAPAQAVSKKHLSYVPKLGDIVFYLNTVMRVNAVWESPAFGVDVTVIDEKASGLQHAQVGVREIATMQFIRHESDAAPVFKPGQPVRHKTLHYKGIVSSLYPDATVTVNVADFSGKGAVYFANQYPVADLEAVEVRLPERQVEFLQALKDGKPVKKNAATRMALRRYGMITQTDVWADIKLTLAGVGWLENFGQVLKQAEKAEAQIDVVDERPGIAMGKDWLGWDVCYSCGELIPAADHPVIVTKLGSVCSTCFGTVEIDQSQPAKPTFGTASKVTPLRQQYLDIKAQYPDCVLFFRLGDFYETFDDDAETAAKACDLVLTGRPISRNERVPMAGVPHHALDQYVEMLLKAGYHVAVCEQMSEPDGRGIVERKVTRVLTPKDLAPKVTMITIKTHHDPRQIEALNIIGQFAIHHTLLTTGVSKDTYTLTHVLSGMALENNYPNRDELVELAEALGSLDIDSWWKGDKKDTSIFDEARAIRKGWMGEPVQEMV